MTLKRWMVIVATTALIIVLRLIFGRTGSIPAMIRASSDRRDGRAFSGA
jgi:hypothetical protein